MSTNLQTVVERALAGSMDFAEVQRWVAANRALYQRPKLDPVQMEPPKPDSTDRRTIANDWIHLYSDWEERSQDLFHILGQLHRTTIDDASANQLIGLQSARLLYHLSKLIDDPAKQGNAAFLLGYTYWRACNWFDAAGVLSEAVSLLKGSGDDGLLEVSALSYLCHSLRENKQFDQAIVRSEELLSKARAMKLRGQEALALKDLGEAHAQLGRATESLEYLRLAVANRRVLSDAEVTEQSVVPLPAFLNAQGLAARKAGNFDLAFRAFLEIAEIHRAEQDRSMEALALSEIGYTFRESGDAAKAAESLSRAIDLEEQHGRTQLSERWRVQLARLQRGNAAGIVSDESVEIEAPPEAAAPTDAASAYYQAELAADLALGENAAAAVELASRVLDWATQRRDAQLQVVCHNVLGVAHEKLGRSKDSINSFRKGIQLADGGGGGAAASLMLRWNLAKVLLISKEYKQGVEVLQHGIAHGQMLLKQADTFAFKQQIIAGVLPIYEMLVSFLGQAGDDRNHEYLLKYMELVRARNIAAWSRTQAQLEGIALPAEMRSLIGEKTKEIRAIEVELDLRHLLDILASADATRLQSRLKALETELDQIMLDPRLPSRPTKGPSFFDPQKEVDDALAGGLPRDTAVLSLFSTPEGICASVYHRGEEGLKFGGTFVPWDRGERVQTLASMNEHLAGARTRSFNSHNRPRSSDRKAPESSDGDHALSVLDARFYGALIELVRRFAPNRLFVIPHRELSVVPFWQILENCGSVESISAVPSLSVMQVCTKRSRNARGDTCLVGDFTRTLPQAAAELKVIAACRKEKVEAIASVDQLIAAGPRCNLLHVAAHGMFKPSNPYFSGFVMGRDARAAGPFVQFVELFSKEGVITLQFSDKPEGLSYRLMTVADCMSKLSLDSCRLVVLSACESGLAHTHGGGELMGLPNALLVAGAKSVIAPLWPVDDTATMVLMKTFYGIWEGGTGTDPSPAHSLALARKRLRTMTRAEVASVAGSQMHIPEGTTPYSTAVYSDAFQCFGDF